MAGPNIVRGRNNMQLAQSVVGADFKDLKYEVSVSSANNSHNPDAISLESPQKQPFRRPSEEVTQGAQLGIRKAEAAALAWSKKTAYLTYALVWLGFFMLALQSAVSTNVIHNAFAHFEEAPAVSTSSIVASVVSGVVRLPAAKLLNIWGRPEGLSLFLAVYLLGLIILAACNNPSSFAVGYVLYWVGYDAIFLILDVFIADTSGLRNRAFAFGFASTPFICTAFTGPIAAQSFVDHSTWRWAYGTFAIAQVFVFLPLIAVFKFYQRKAEKMFIFVREPSGRTWTQSIIFWLNEFDCMRQTL
ncbi:unnamed protein product [Aspergillus oryzae]|uniref:Unnamed protein product n=2 Tax=Aspergillus oryzae TaxID=5062 RepID=A0AAN5BVW3_ASPOZ|nr:unnamed protein product [Aspergillus oryzae]GMF93743.1 unnamed protein product [Aspergillus oryzae]GMG27880.1 unnamed protein product [Aspergillus oryzae]GMG50787.1 unnamed protein product [Aspergillus oryzae var. brunneus]